MKIIWVTWEKQRRNAGLAAGVGAELYELISDKNRIFRYLDLTWLTLKIIYSNRPNVVVAQNPSIVLSLLVVLSKRIFKYKAIVDAHNSGIFPCESKYKLLNILSVFIQREACLTLVTNQYLRSHVESNGGKGFVLPDRIPTPPRLKKVTLDGDKNIVLICTYSSDEPYSEVIKAARNLGVEYKIYITGNFKGKIDPSKIPVNVELLGFLPEESYWNFLNSSDVIMDLTTREDCLVCGAYEGVSLARPLVLSNTRINKEFFNIGCVYVDPNSQSICDGILECFASYPQYKDQIVNLKINMEEESKHKIDNLLKEFAF